MKLTRTFLLVALSTLTQFWSGVPLNAQCSRVGWVASFNPDCGAKIIDLDSGELLRTSSGGGNLTPGQTFSFEATPAQPLITCHGDTLPAIKLTCTSDELPCKAQFVPYPDDSNPLRMHFAAQIYDPTTQVCIWDFGDGTTASGHQTEHTYAYEGFFTVKLTVSGSSCSASLEQEVFVSEQNLIHCGYEIAVTAVDMKVLGDLTALSASSGQLTEISWFIGKTNQVIGQATNFEYEAQAFGSYNVCADYKVKFNDGSSCAATQCSRLSIAEPGCVNPEMALPNIICPTYSVPVCGCDGVTYANECEAMISGVNTWWAGFCGQPTPGTCNADLAVVQTTGSPDKGFWVLFKNLAGGNFSNLQLDFGDGTPLHTVSNWDTLSHFYPHCGNYLANLTAWKEGSCISSVSKIVTTDAASATESLPQALGYVLPGDADGDRVANVYDLLNIGVGYFSKGVPRPFASTAWERQIAPNWQEETPDGINFKHMDCDGNGAVNELDPALITKYYTPIDTSKIVVNPSAPKVWLDFSGNPDTIFIEENKPQTVEISADVYVASPDEPIFDLYGLAFAMKYPHFIQHDPVVDYYDDSNFGHSNYILWLPKDNYARKQLDLGFVRKDGQGRSGYFKLAKVTFKADFIIIVDIVDRSSTKTEAFSANIRGLKAIDPQGREKELTASETQDVVWIKMKETTASHDPVLSEKIAVFPNPASESASVFTADLDVQSIEVVNVLGQVTRQLTPSGERITQFDVSDWAGGIYTLRIRTEEGLAEKKIVVK